MRPRGGRHGGERPVEVAVGVAWSKRCGQTIQPWKSGGIRRASSEAQARDCIVLQRRRRRTVGVVEALIAYSGVDQESRGDWLIVVQARNGAIDRLHAHGRDRLRQAIVTGQLIRGQLVEVKRQSGIIGQNLIDLDGWSLLIIWGRVQLHVVAGGIRVGRLWDQVLNLDRYGIEPALRNLVAGEHRRHDLPVWQRGTRGWIVDRAVENRLSRRIGADILAGKKGDGTEVTGPHGGRRQGQEARSVGIGHVAEDLFAEEEERLVLAVVEFRDIDRTTDRAAEIVLAAARIGLRNGGGKIRPLRVQVFVRQVFVRAAMQLVGSRLGGEVVEPTAHLAELRGKGAGLQRELLYCVHG